MDALVKALEKVVESGEWFVRTPSVRVLHVVTNKVLRLPVLQHLVASELLEPNTSPFFVLEAPTEPGDDGWTLRADELRADWKGLCDSAPDSSLMGPLWPEESQQQPLARFSAELGLALASIRSPMTGLVLVLAPVWIRDRTTWCRDLTALFRAKGLEKARFVVVEVDEPESLAVIKQLGPAAEQVDARVSDASLGEEMSARLEAMKNAPSGATGFALVGGAGPAVAPPKRASDPPRVPPEQRQSLAAELGISPALFDLDLMKQLRVLVMSAAGAMRAGQATEAVRLQREARDLCVKHAMVREAVVNELVLGGYVLQGGAPELALKVFGDGRKRAEAAGLIDMAVQAQIAKGSCLLVMKRVDEAVAAYDEGGQLGASASAPVLGIESYRMCGQLLVSKGRLKDAATAFRRAIDTAERGGDQVKRDSSIVDVMRQLAALCRKHGLVQQADSLEAQAVVIEDAKLAASSNEEPSGTAPAGAESHPG